MNKENQRVITDKNIKSNKHIEEMAKCCTYYHNGKCCADVTHICDCDLMCEMYGVFANLERASYRKASDVIDEFAERLKATPKWFKQEYIKYFDKPSIVKLVPFIDKTDIDQIANEMKGEGK